MISKWVSLEVETLRLLMEKSALSLPIENEGAEDLSPELALLEAVPVMHLSWK